MVSVLFFSILILSACSSQNQYPDASICGGMAAVQCEDGLLCLFDGAHEGAEGVCLTAEEMAAALAVDAQPATVESNQALDQIDGQEPQETRTPYYDKAMLATSVTGNDWELINDNLAVQASVPDATVLHTDIGEFTAGTIMSVFVYMSENTPGVEELGIIYSTDNGITWSDLQILTLDSPEEHLPVDPSIIQLDDGTLMIHYFDFSRTKQISSADPYYIYATSSTDGINYTIEQEPVYVSQVTITDPDVIYYNDRWYMFFVSWDDASEEDIEGPSINIAVGDSPYGFTYDSDTHLQGIPGTLENQNSELELYGCDNGITRLVSTDVINFDLQGTYPLRGCDPAPVQLEDESYVMLLKGFSD